jgi:hypothetical protein
MDFSGGISAFVLPMMSRQSPDVTAFTLPLNHPEAPVLVAMIAAYTLLDQMRRMSIYCETSVT